MTKKILLVMIFIILLLPIYFMAIGGFQDIKGVLRMPPSLYPRNPTLSNYINMLGWPMIKWATNTFIEVMCTVVLTIIICSTAAYSFAFYSFRFKKILWTALLIGIMIPRISLIIPTFVIIKKIGISGTLAATILPIAYMPVGLYIARIYFETIPKSLLESARLDGANEIQILSKIVAPMSKPIITALALFSSINALGDYIWQMLVLMKEERQTLLVGMMKMVITRGAGDINLNPVGRSLAVGTFLLIPLLAIFLLANKYFTQSLGGAIKE